MLYFAALPLILSMVAAPGPIAGDVPATVEIDVDGLRSTRGMLQVCITQDKRHFPDCARDPQSVRLTAPAATRQLRFPDLPAGRYAVTLFHDENANHRLDKMLGVPREGFGFSRNPVIRFGAPRFDKVVIQLDGGITRAQVRLQYLL